MLDVFGVLFSGDGPVESDAERGVGAAVDHVPHFGFAVGAVPLGGQIVVRMHLDRQGLLYVEVLDEQRKLKTEALVYAVADQLAHVDLDQFLQIVAFQRAVADDRPVAVEAGELPAFADGASCGKPFAQLLAEPAASPYLFLENRFEFQRIKHLIRDLPRRPPVLGAEPADGPRCGRCGAGLKISTNLSIYGEICIPLSAVDDK